MKKELTLETLAALKDQSIASLQKLVAAYVTTRGTRMDPPGDRQDAVLWAPPSGSAPLQALALEGQSFEKFYGFTVEGPVVYRNGALVTRQYRDLSIEDLLRLHESVQRERTRDPLPAALAARSAGTKPVAALPEIAPEAPLVPAAPAVSVLPAAAPRGRGRPKKVPDGALLTPVAPACVRPSKKAPVLAVAVAVLPTSPARGRGHPKKVTADAVPVPTAPVRNRPAKKAPAVAVLPAVPAVPARGRGRPRKVLADAVPAIQAPTVPAPSVPAPVMRGRGRPRKVPLQVPLQGMAPARPARKNTLSRGNV